MMVAEFFFFF